MPAKYEGESQCVACGINPAQIRSLEHDVVGRIPVAELVQMRIVGRRRAR